MKKILFFIFILLSVSAVHAAERSVLVSVAPYKKIIRTLVGQDVDVVLLVPQGASFHSYEPSPKQLQAASECSIWFTIGDPFEKKAQVVLTEHHPDMHIVDLRQGLSLIHSGCCHHHHDEHEGDDPHIWMSLRLMQKQIDTIAFALIQQFPERKERIEKKTLSFKQKLQQLDQRAEHVFAQKQQRTLFVSHPAYGYFCRDYGLEEISIEQEGKDPGPKQVVALVKEGKDKKIKKIFVQPQYSTKAAYLFSKVLSAGLVLLDPYSEEYLENIEALITAVDEAL